MVRGEEEEERKGCEVHVLRDQERKREEVMRGKKTLGCVRKRESKENRTEREQDDWLR